jgi:signal peptidase II
MRWTVAITAALCLAADLATKIWVRANVAPGQHSVLVPYLLNLTITSNSGAAFGLGRGSSAVMTTIAAVILLTVVAWVVKRERQPDKPAFYERLGMGLLIGGALGNLLDRLTVGRVTDFLEFSFIDFPIFNLADVCIDAGAILILAKAFLRQPVCFYAQTAREKSETCQASAERSAEDRESR